MRRLRRYPASSGIMQYTLGNIAAAARLGTVIPHRGETPIASATVAQQPKPLNDSLRGRHPLRSLVFRSGDRPKALNG